MTAVQLDLLDDVVRAAWRPRTLAQLRTVVARRRPGRDVRLSDVECCAAAARRLGLLKMDTNHTVPLPVRRFRRVWGVGRG